MRLSSPVKNLSHSQLLATLILLISLLSAVNVSALNLKQAEQLATQSDPLIEGFKATSHSYEHQSVADNSLPDPQLRLGATNVPVDSFDLQQEAMTQLKVGIVQKFPRGDVLSIKQKQSQYLSQWALAMAGDAQLKILKNVRETYLNLYYEVSAYQIVSETRKLFSELVKITESNYAAGRVNQQDVILAGLGLARLDDRTTKIKAREEGYRVTLSQWIGEVAWTDISAEFPKISALPTSVNLNQVIAQHPLILAQTAKVNANVQLKQMAKQQYKPGWSLLFDYGFRSGNNPDGSARADFATAIVSLDVPLFTGNRQDKIVASNEQKIVAARYEKDDQLRKLKQFYEKNKLLWLRLGEREALYKNSLLKAATSNSRAALRAYQSGISEFNTLMRAEITTLDVRLENLRIRIERSAAQAKLRYIIGDLKEVEHNEIK